jgi:hypothetical protein
MRLLEKRKTKKEIHEALWCAAIVGEGLEETLWGLWRHFSPPTLAIIIINDSEKEKQVEKKTTEAEANQLVVVEQSVDILSKLVKGRFFDVEPNSLILGKTS